MPTSADLTGRHVVITGARGGLGGAVVEAFVGAGAVCHLPERSPGAESVQGNVHAIPGVDLTKEDDVRALYERLPPLWASVHLAGGFAAAPFLQTKLADLRAMLDLNLTTAFLCCREAARKMTAGGGRIVNVTTRSAAVPVSGSIAYATAKAGVAWLTRCLAEELAPQRILVNAIAPSTIDTPANRASMPNADHSRWPKPAELAQAILWLASPLNGLTSGAIVPVYGSG